MLTEEKWTRAAIGNYTKNHFIELAAVVEKARAENCMDEVQNACNEHLAHTKNSIIALYISGMLGLKNRKVKLQKNQKGSNRSHRRINENRGQSG